MNDREVFEPVRFVPHRYRSVTLSGCDWAPEEFADDNHPRLCRNSDGSVFIGTKRKGRWIDFYGIERKPVEFALGLE